MGHREEEEESSIRGNCMQTRWRREREERSVSIWAGCTAGDQAMTFCPNATALKPELLEGKAGVLTCRS